MPDIGFTAHQIGFGTNRCFVQVSQRRQGRCSSGMSCEYLFGMSGSAISGRHIATKSAQPFAMISSAISMLVIEPTVVTSRSG